METEAVESFFGWINERHRIYQSRLAGKSPPWTEDPILSEYKFTNPFRENDRVTVWMRENWTNPHSFRPHSEIIFNCCLFRMVGTIEFAVQHGWVNETDGWDPNYTKFTIEKRLDQNLPTFTGAYIITNQGIKAPKSHVVTELFLKPIWENKKTLALHISEQGHSLQHAHKRLGKYKGFGGGGFMAYEVITDLFYTPVLEHANDRYFWANAGPGAKRGLNRLYGRPLKASIKDKKAQEEMRILLLESPKYIQEHINIDDIDMRTIEHSLCEWDKYQRVKLNQGRPRSRFKPKRNIPKGAVI